MEGSPSDPNGGSLVRANRDGTFTVIADKLNQPTSMEIVGDTAYVVMLSGEVWRVDNLPGPGRGGHDNGEGHGPGSPFSDRKVGDRGRGSFFDDDERDDAGNRQLLLASGPR